MLKRFFKKRGIRLYQKPDREISERDLDFLVCPNCGETETGNFCANCGQSNLDYNKPVKEIIGDLAESINLDIRLKNTLIPFFIKPGFLTEEYFKGRRKRYVPPMRMYIIMSIIFFFIVEKYSIQELNATNDALMKTDSIESPFFVYSNNDSVIDIANTNDSVIDIANTNKEQITKEVKEDSLGNTILDKIIDGGNKASENEGAFTVKVIKNTSRLFFILMPIFALILMLIHRKTKMLYIKHLIFSINFHSFAFALIAIIIAILMYAPGISPDNISLLGWGIPIYLIFGMKHFYQRSYFRSMTKTLGILSLYSIILLIILTSGVVWTVYQF